MLRGTELQLCIPIAVLVTIPASKWTTRELFCGFDLDLAFRMSEIWNVDVLHASTRIRGLARRAEGLAT